MTKNPPIMNDPEAAREMARLRDLVERGLGAAPWQVTAVDADDEGGLIVRLKPKARDVNQTAKSIVDLATRED